MNQHFGGRVRTGGVPFICPGSNLQNKGEWGGEDGGGARRGDGDGILREDDPRILGNLGKGKKIPYQEPTS